MKTIHKKLPLLFTVKFTAAEHGWLDFEIPCHQQFFYDNFSAIYDPIPALKTWLEALSNGVSEATFTYNNESYDISFHIQKLDNEKDQFSIYFDEEMLLFQVIVNRKQLVRSFYLGLLNFAYSQKYIPYMWEKVLIKDLLMEYFAENESQLLQRLLAMPTEQLRHLFGIADEYNYVFATLDFSKEPESYWELDDNYDQFTLEQKQDYLQNILQDFVSNGFDASPLKAIQSNIIDKYLSITPKTTMMQGHYYFQKWLHLDNSANYCFTPSKTPSSVCIPFKNPYWNHFEKGIYIDKNTGDPLFSSLSKLDDGSGWPCFYDPIENRKLDFQRKENQVVRVFSRYSKEYLGYLVFNENIENDIIKNYCQHNYYRVETDILLFVPLTKMAQMGYGNFVPYLMGY